ncbi:MAG: flippase [Nanoarchaeota archaeon]
MDSSSLKKVTKGAFYVFIGLIVSKLLTYVYRIIVARIGATEYGLLNIGLAVIGVVSIFCLLGFEEGLLRYISYYKALDDKKRVTGLYKSSLKISLAISIVFAILLYYYSNSIAIFIFHNQNLISVLKIFSIVLPFFVVYKLNLASIRALQDIKGWTYIGNIAESAIRLILTVVLILLGLKLFGVIIAYLLTIVFVSTISFYYLTRIVKFVKNKVSTNLTKELVRYSWPLMFSSILIAIMAWTDTLILGYFKTASDVGVYNAALPTSTLLYIIPMALLSLFIPLLTELLALNKRAEFRSLYDTTNRWIFFANFPLFVLLVLFSKQILAILFGQAYINGYTALIILSVGYVIYFAFETSNKILNVLNKTKLVLINTAIATMLNVVLNLILVPILGINGAAIATASSLVSTNFLAFIEVRRFAKLNPLQIIYFKSIAASVVAGFVVYLIKSLIDAQSLIAVILLGILFLSIYLAGIALLKSFLPEDIEIIKILQTKTGVKLNAVSNFIKRFI